MSRHAPSSKRVLTYLQRYGEINGDMIREISGTRISPSQVIYHLRSKGHTITAQRCGRVTTWTYAAEDIQLEKKRHNEEGPSLDVVYVTCRLCERKLAVKVWPGNTPDTRRICANCLEIKDHDGHFFNNNNTPQKLTASARRKCEVRTSSRCKTYRPGDKGFKERAQQCTPPRQIKRKASDLVKEAIFTMEF